MGISNFVYSNPTTYEIGNMTYNWFSSFSDGLARIVSNFLMMISALIQSAQDLINGLLDISDLLSDMNTGLVTGNTEGFPILEAVGTYRYLVGDFLFYLTYLVIALGLMLTIWHIVRIVYARVTKLSGVGKLGTSLLNYRYLP